MVLATPLLLHKSSASQVICRHFTIVQGQLRSVRRIATTLPPDLKGHSLKKASCPSQNIECNWSNADLVALYTDCPPADLPFWFVTCASAPQAGQAVTILGHGGAPLSFEIACTAAATAFSPHVAGDCVLNQVFRHFQQVFSA